MEINPICAVVAFTQLAPSLEESGSEGALTSFTGHGSPLAGILLRMFSDTLLDHFQNPRNAGELPGATVKVEVSNPVCGDILQLAAILDGQRIREVRFLCRGCTAAIAAASLLTEKIKGRELRDTRLLSSESIAQEFGGLPPASFHAAHLAHDALRALVARSEAQ